MNRFLHVLRGNATRFNAPALLLLAALILVLCGNLTLPLKADVIEQFYPSPVLPGNPDKLLDLLSSPRDDIRRAAMSALLRAKYVNPEAINRRLGEFSANSQLYLYEVAGMWGNEKTVEILVAIYTTLPVRSHQAIRLMENILFLGTHYRLPIDFLPFLLRAWLEGDEFFSLTARAALQKMGTSAMPELRRLLFSSDPASLFSVMSLMIEVGETPSTRLCDIALDGGPMASLALDVVMVGDETEVGLASDIFANNKLPWPLRRRALFWLVYREHSPPASLLLDVIRQDNLELAADALKVMRLLCPTEWGVLESELLCKEREIDARFAGVLLYCGDRESLELLLHANCAVDVQATRMRLVEQFAGPVLGNLGVIQHCELRAAIETRPHSEESLSFRLADIAQLYLRAGKPQAAASGLSRALLLKWDRQSSEALARILSNDPSLSRGYFLEPYCKWASTQPELLSDFDHYFASALGGSYSDCIRAVNRPTGETQDELDLNGLLERMRY